MADSTQELQELPDSPVRFCLSGTHLTASDLMRDRIAEIEHSAIDRFPVAVHEPVVPQQQAYTVAALMSAASFLEANINELYVDAFDPDTRIMAFGRMYHPAADRLGRMWKIMSKNRSISILQKYQIALELADATSFDQGRNTYQAVDTLVLLRNALVHSEPRWDIDKAHRKIADKVRALNITLNPLVDPTSQFFPDRCLASGLASWAIGSVVDFIVDFNGRMDIPIPTVNGLPVIGRARLNSSRATKSVSE